MCPSNKRAAGARNPKYEGTFIFDNDYPALLPAGAEQSRMEEDGLLVATSETGLCRVLCFSPRHDLTMSRMEIQDLRCVVDAWAQQWEELGAYGSVNYVQIFENRGAMMGASNPHPHGQIWASSSLPDEPAKEQEAQRRYLKSHHSCYSASIYRERRNHGNGSYSATNISQLLFRSGQFGPSRRL